MQEKGFDVWEVNIKDKENIDKYIKKWLQVNNCKIEGKNDEKYYIGPNRFRFSYSIDENILKIKTCIMRNSKNMIKVVQTKSYNRSYINTLYTEQMNELINKISDINQGNYNMEELNKKLKELEESKIKSNDQLAKGCFGLAVAGLIFSFFANPTVTSMDLGIVLVMGFAGRISVKKEMDVIYSSSNCCFFYFNKFIYIRA